ncbi:MAG: ROK family protein [bacterium]|jgi:predicted NBD/HSP70 family sugar kinase
MKRKLAIPAPLDPGFQPAIVFNQSYIDEAKASGQAVLLILGLEREEGFLSRYTTIVKPDTNPDTLLYVERIIKFILWARGGWKIHFGGPKAIGEYIKQCYSTTGVRAFDVDLMSKVYEKPFEVVLTEADKVPAAREMSTTVGGHLDGCRIGFDLGASDYKISAVLNGEAVYTDEFPWDPKNQPDPNYHFTLINEGFKKAAAKLPRVDAIGGSSAGVIVNNRIMVASLFRAVPASKFDQAKNIFLRLREVWNVPMEVVNDGDVTALAGAMSLNTTAMLGVAMGSSEAGGYMNPEGGMTGWLSELAFAPVDYNASAPADEWSGDHGVGALYFSQQAVNKLLPAAGIEAPSGMGLPERLKMVQELMAKGDPRAVKIYETIGVYLGYTLPHYANFYEYKNILILGRVTTGAGGDIILAKAREVLNLEFPEIANRIQIVVPDEKSRRIGQAVAAASLPMIKG